VPAFNMHKIDEVEENDVDNIYNKYVRAHDKASDW
jgi:hypothetical protein